MSTKGDIGASSEGDQREKRTLNFKARQNPMGKRKADGD